ncbi:Ubiquitin-associated [Gracilaria domingensis]|nr:Ubiquitin-associated [Gracilaria domingensis]
MAHKGDEENPPVVRNKSSRRVKRSKSTFHVPKGFVSVNRPQRLYAAFGFLWVAVGLAMTAAAAAIVFIGQRERFQQVANSLGNQQEDWKTWIIPICTGGILVLVFGTLAITTFIKFFSTLGTRPSLPLRNTTASEGSVREVEDLDLLYKTGKELPDDDLGDTELPAVPPPAAIATNKGVINATALPNAPEQRTIDRLMRQLRDMGFKNPDQNMAALQASSFDLEKASDKLANTAT